MGATLQLDDNLLLDDEQEWARWYESLTEQERSDLARSVQNAPRVAPNPGPQTMAFNSEADIVGYGGSAGGGKSALIALLSILSHTRSVIYRFDAKQLRGLIDDLASFWGTTTGLNRQAGVFRFGDRAGHMVEWGGIGGPGDASAWQGRAHDLLCVDEATQIPEAVYQYLKTWLRTTIPGQRCRILLTFNPPGGPDDVGGGSGRWVIDYFAPWIDERHLNPAQPGELRWFGPDPDTMEVVERPNGDPYELTMTGGDGETITYLHKPESRTFIPARVWDNPFLRNTNYERNLVSLTDKVLRQQMLLGDFRSGIMDAEWQVIPTAWIDEAMGRWTPAGASEPMTALGCDVARGGRDSTILAPRHGWWWDQVKTKPGTDCRFGPDVASFCVENMRDRAEICIDVVGVGSSPHDHLVTIGARVVGIQGSQQKNLPRIDMAMECLNRRSWLYWLLRQVLDPANKLMPALPPDNRLRAELIAHRYSRGRGVIQVEAKEDMKKRLGYSPDRADAVAYSVYHALDTPGGERLNARPHAEVDKAKLYGPGYGSGGGRGARSTSWMGR